MKAAFSIALVISVLYGCGNKETDLATCHNEALSLFGQLRKPHPLSGNTWPSEQEVVFVANCMVVKGYTYKSTCASYTPGAPDVMQLSNMCWVQRGKRFIP